MGSGWLYFFAWPALLVALGTLDDGLSGSKGLAYALVGGLVVILISDGVRNGLAADRAGIAAPRRWPRAGKRMAAMVWIPVLAIIATNLLIRPLGWWVGLPVGLAAMVAVRIAKARWRASFRSRSQAGAVMGWSPAPQLSGIPSDGSAAQTFTTDVLLRLGAALAIADRARAPVLASTLGVNPAELERATSMLDDEGLTTTTPDPDGRGPVVQITAEGRRRFAADVRRLERG